MTKSTDRLYKNKNKTKKKARTSQKMKKSRWCEIVKMWAIISQLLAGSVQHLAWTIVKKGDVHEGDGGGD